MNYGISEKSLIPIWWTTKLYAISERVNIMLFLSLRTINGMSTYVRLLQTSKGPEVMSAWVCYVCKMKVNEWDECLGMSHQWLHSYYSNSRVSIVLGFPPSMFTMRVKCTRKWLYIQCRLVVSKLLCGRWVLVEIWRFLGIVLLHGCSVDLVGFQSV